jgi:hypothetical protein
VPTISSCEDDRREVEIRFAPAVTGGPSPTTLNLAANCGDIRKCVKPDFISSLPRSAPPRENFHATRYQNETREVQNEKDKLISAGEQFATRLAWRGEGRHRG